MYWIFVSLSLVITERWLSIASEMPPRIISSKYFRCSQQIWLNIVHLKMLETEEDVALIYVLLNEKSKQKKIKKKDRVREIYKKHESLVTCQNLVQELNLVTGNIISSMHNFSMFNYEVILFLQVPVLYTFQITSCQLFRSIVRIP